MKKIIFLLLLVLIATPCTANCAESGMEQAFGKLSGVESAFKTLARQIDKAAGMEAQPDRVYAMQDIAGLCKTSLTQIHSLNSLFSVVNLVKREKRFESREAAMLKKKCSYAFNDFNRRRAFAVDILTKAKDRKLKDLAQIFDAQLSIVLKQLNIINAELK